MEDTDILGTKKHNIISTSRLIYLFLKGRCDFLYTEIWRAILLGLEMIASVFVHLGTFAVDVRIFLIKRRWVRYHHVAQSHVFIIISIVRDASTDSDEEDIIYFLESTCTKTNKRVIF